MKKHVLIVEDEEGIQTMMRLGLEMYGYDSVSAMNGREALEILRKDPAPGMILMDLMMPVMNGWTLAKELAADPKLRDIPLVVMTAFPDRAQEISNARGVLPKPTDFEELIIFVQQYCGEEGVQSGGAKAS